MDPSYRSIGGYASENTNLQDNRIKENAILRDDGAEKTVVLPDVKGVVDNAVQMMMVIRKWSKKTNTYQYGKG
jgi:hypothetical protein